MAKHTEEKHIMNFACIVVLLTSFYTPVDLFGVELICPTFIDGQNSVFCKINRTAVRVAECETVQEFVTLEKTTVSRQEPRVINSTKSFVQSDCRHRQKPVPDGSWCNELNGEIFEYEFAFVVSRIKDTGAQLECIICISPKNAFEIKVNDNCKSMHFDDGGSATADYSSGIISASILIVLIQDDQHKKPTKSGLNAASLQENPQKYICLGVLAM